MPIAEILIAALFGIIFVVLLAYKIVFSNDKIDKLKAQISNKTFSKENYIEEKNLSSTRKIVKIVLCFVLLLSSLTVFVTSICLRSPNKNSQYFSLSVNSDSMSAALNSNSYIKENKLEEKIAIYDVVQFEKTNEDTQLELYDIVLYKTNGDDKLIVHRIIKINEDGTFETRGDFVSFSDKVDLKRDDIIGKYVKSYPFASFVNYLTYTPGFYVFFIGISAFLIIDFVFEDKEKKLISNY